MIYKMNSIIEKRPAITLAACIVLYCITFSALTFWKYHNFYYDNLDLAIFNNVFFNTASGNLFASSIHAPSYLGDHFSPFILLLTPLYALFKTPLLLLIIETVAYGLCAWPLFLLSKKIFDGKNMPALGISLLWLLNPLVHNGNFFEVHFVSIAALFILWSFYCYQIKKTLLFALSILGALFIREDVALITIFFSVLALIQHRTIFWKLFPFVISIAYSIISFSVIRQFAENGGYKFLSLYGWLGGSTLFGIIISFLTHPMLVVQNFFTWTNLEFLLGLIFPFFFLVLTPSVYLLLLLSPLLQITLTHEGGGALILMTHYGTLFLPALFITFASRMKNIYEGTFPRLIPAPIRNIKLMWGIVFASTLYASATYGSLVTPFAAEDNHAFLKEKAVAMIPDDAVVAATYGLLTPLSSREKIYSLHYAYIGTTQYAQHSYKLPADTEYLVIDWEDMLKAEMHFKEHHRWQHYTDSMPNNLDTILRNYSLVFEEGPISVWKKHSQDGRSMGESTSTPTQSTLVTTISDPLLGRPHNAPVIETATRHDNHAHLDVLLPLTPNTAKRYFVEVTTEKIKYTVPLGFGLYPPSQWQGISGLSIHLEGPHNDPIQKITLFEWERGYIKLGPLKNLITVHDAREIDSKNIAY